MSELVNGTRGWIEKADHDLGSAKVIYLHLPDYFETIAFHCQQAAEKYIKAVLFFNRIEFQRSHDLIYLLELLSRKIEINESWYKIAVSLNSFSVQIRYPNTIIKLSKEEIESSIQIAEDFRKFAIQLTEIK
jgi:HEPN domain-containing protein